MAPQENIRRSFLGKLDHHIEAIEKLLASDQLKHILASGGFPETEANSLKKAFTAFLNEHADFTMALLIEFDQPE